MPGDRVGGAERLVVLYQPWKVLLSGVCMAGLIPGAIAFGVLVPGVQSKILMVGIVLSIGWALSIFFRRVLPRLRAGPVGYTIDDSGIHGEALEVPFVAWEDVVSAKLAPKRSTGLIELTLVNYEKYVPPELLTARHRLVKRIAPVAMGTLDLATGSGENSFAAANTDITTHGDVDDVRDAARDVADGLLRVPTRGFDHNATQVLGAINSRLAFQRPTRPAA
jgi:hypothetical protein